MTDIVERAREYNQQRKTDLERNRDIPPCGRQKCSMFFDEMIAEIERLRAALASCESTVLDRADV